MLQRSHSRRKNSLSAVRHNSVHSTGDGRSTWNLHLRRENLLACDCPIHIIVIISAGVLATPNKREGGSRPGAVRETSAFLFPFYDTTSITAFTAFIWEGSGSLFVHPFILFRFLAVLFSLYHIISLTN